MNPNPSIQFHPDEERVSEEELLQFETELGYTLPRDYFEFLLEYNGGAFAATDPGVTESAGLYFEVQDFDGQDEYRCDVAYFIGLFENPARYGLRQQHETTRDAWGIPASILPFAGSAGPPKIFICLDGELKGKVVINGTAYEEKRDAGEAITPGDFFVVADSFSAFVAGLFWSEEGSPHANP